MRKNPRKIRVMMIPGILPADRMEDKLIIHFQRQSNGGGEVLDVEYPTASQGSAYITFENEGDAQSVLWRQHLLVLHEGCFPLQVSEVMESPTRMDEEQVMVYVTTSLDTQDFPLADIRGPLQRHGLEIVSRAGPLLEIRGSFPALKLLRGELLSLSQSQSQSRSEEKEAGAAKQWGGGTRPKQNGDTWRSPKAPSLLVDNFDGHSLATASADRQENARNSRRAVGKTDNRGKKSSTGPPTELTFPVDETVMDYLLRYKMAEVRAFQNRYSVDLHSQPVGDGLAHVCLFPRLGFVGVPRSGDLHQAKEELCRHVQEVQSGLRELTIELKALDSRNKRKMVERRLSKLADSFQVMCWRDSETIHLIGTSSESYSCRQYLLGVVEEEEEEEGDSPQRGRSGKRSQHRQVRTSSCPAPPDPTVQPNLHHKRSPAAKAKSERKQRAHSTVRAKRAPLPAYNVDTDWVGEAMLTEGLEVDMETRRSHSQRHRKHIKDWFVNSIPLVLKEKPRKDRMDKSKRT